MPQLIEFAVVDCTPDVKALLRQETGLETPPSRLAQLFDEAMLEFDRLELLARTGTDGIDTLDPPPLGNVELLDARGRLGPDLFIKGNVDPVNNLLRVTPDGCYRDALNRIAIAGAAGGYILSTACSVPPHTPPENIAQLARAARDAATGPCHS